MISYGPTDQRDRSGVIPDDAPCVFLAYEGEYDAEWLVGVYTTEEAATKALDALASKRTAGHYPMVDDPRETLDSPRIEIWTLEK